MTAPIAPYGRIDNPLSPLDQCKTQNEKPTSKETQLTAVPSESENDKKRDLQKIGKRDFLSALTIGGIADPSTSRGSDIRLDLGVGDRHRESRRQKRFACSPGRASDEKVSRL